MTRFLLLVALSSLMACGPEDAGDPPCSGVAGCADDDAGLASDAGLAPGEDAGGELPADAGAEAADSGAAPPDAGTPAADAGGPAPAGDDICAIHAGGALMNCSNGYCHGRPAGQNPSGGLHLDHTSPQALHASLVNGEGSSRLFTVVPENPAMSYLLNKLRGTQDDVRNGGGGDQMPQGGPYLNEAQIAQIERWIAAGATAICP